MSWQAKHAWRSHQPPHLPFDPGQWRIVPAAAEEKQPHWMWRHRHLLPPPVWGLTAVVGGGIMRADAAGAVPVIVTSVIAAALIVLGTRHLRSRFTRRWAAAAATCTALALPLIALAGPRPWLPLYAAVWAALAGLWAWQYRVRPGEPQNDAAALWSQTLGADGSLAGSTLSVLEHVPGGTRYRLRLVGGKHDTQTVFAAARRIASLYGKPVTEAFPERFPHAPEHEAVITILRSNSLQKVREWDGTSIDPATGLAVIADYPDGRPGLFQFWQPGSGGTQSVVVGVTGSGKSALLYLLVCIALASEVPVIPIVMDPQEGASLPDVAGAVPYARGPDECIVMLRAIYEGVTARSAAMARTPWTDEEGIVHPGHDRFDPHHTGLPLYLFVFDEAHVVVSHPVYGKEAIGITGKLAKLNRKAGCGLILANHALLLSEIGDNTLRAMAQSGNAIALRVGEGFTGSILGLQADPKLLPLVFPDGSPTHGLGYMKGPSGRPDSPMRIRWVRNPRKHILAHPARPMDDVFGAAFRASVITQAAEGKPGAAALGASLGITEGEVAAAVESAVAAAVRRGTGEPVPPPDESPAPNGKGARDAILSVLDRRMTREELLEHVAARAREWGRERPWSVRAVTGPLRQLVESGQVARPEDGVYAPARPALTVVRGTD